MDWQILHDSDSLASRAELTRHSELLLTAVWRADPRILAASCDGTVSIYDSDGQMCFTKGPFRDLIGFASASRCFVWLASCADGIVHVFDGSKHLCSFRGSPRRTQNVIFSSDGLSVLTPAEGCTVKSFDAQSGQCLSTYGGFDSDVCSIILSPDGVCMLCTTVGGFAVAFSARSEQQVHMTQAGKWSRCAHFMSTPGSVLAVLRDGTARIFDTRSGHVTAHLRENTAASNAAVSQDGSKIALVFSDCTAKVYTWRDPQLQVVCSLLVTNLGDYIPPQPVTFSADSTKILFALDSCHIRVLDANTGEFVSLCEGGTQHITTASFSPDARIVLASYYRSVVNFFETTSGTRVKQLGSKSSTAHAFLAAEFAWALPLHQKCCASALHARGAPGMPEGYPCDTPVPPTPIKVHFGGPGRLSVAYAVCYSMLFFGLCEEYVQDRYDSPATSRPASTQDLPILSSDFKM